jgi:hypothetical protein
MWRSPCPFVAVQLETKPDTVRALRAARDWSVPYTVLTGQRLPGQRWTVRDRTLAEALVEYEGGSCPGCGQPKSKAWNEKTDGWWGQESVTCYSCKAAEEQREITKKQAGEDEKPGRLTFMSLDEGWRKGRD